MAQRSRNLAHGYGFHRRKARAAETGGGNQAQAGASLTTEAAADGTITTLLTEDNLVLTTES